ncbi:hypothetical protein CSUI_002518 [Cystoisospora suis]|uniref:Transmembrane protein n=1 Tax=Cystoisospora suis TaxID=483139 RepID=A0A2C6L7S2_9APIC|nr:hypothetical protein CSUI_002518 [Cystoisospora suis]
MTGTPPRPSSNTHLHGCSHSSVRTLETARRADRNQNVFLMRLFLFLFIADIVLIRSSVISPPFCPWRRSYKTGCGEHRFTSQPSSEGNQETREWTKPFLHLWDTQPREGWPLDGKATQDSSNYSFDDALLCRGDPKNDSLCRLWRLRDEIRKVNVGLSSPYISRRCYRELYCTLLPCQTSPQPSYVRGERWSAPQEVKRTCAGVQSVSEAEEESRTGRSLLCFLSSILRNHGEGNSGTTGATGKSTKVMERDGLGTWRKGEERKEIGRRKTKRRKRREEAKGIQRDATRARQRQKSQTRDKAKQENYGEWLRSWWLSLFGRDRDHDEYTAEEGRNPAFFLFAQGIRISPSPSFTRVSLKTDNSFENVDIGKRLPSERNSLAESHTPSLLRARSTTNHDLMNISPTTADNARKGGSSYSLAVSCLYTRKRLFDLRRLHRSMSGRLSSSLGIRTSCGSEEEREAQGYLVSVRTPGVLNKSTSYAGEREHGRRSTTAGSPLGLRQTTNIFQKGAARRARSKPTHRLCRRKHRERSMDDSSLANTRGGSTAGLAPKTSIETRHLKFFRMLSFCFHAFVRRPSSSSSSPSSSFPALYSFQQRQISPPLTFSHRLPTRRGLTAPSFVSPSVAPGSSFSSSSSISSSSSSTSRPSTEPARDEENGISLDYMAEFQRKMEELTGHELLAELKKRKISVPGKEPEKITDALVRVIHDELRALDQVHREERLRRREENIKDRKEHEEKKERLLSCLQQLSPSDALAYLQSQQRQPTGKEEEEVRENGLFTDTPRGAASEDTFGESRTDTKSRPSQGHFEDMQSGPDPSGIEPPEIRFFPEAACEDFWKPRYAWRSELATLEDQLELFQDTVDRARQEIVGVRSLSGGEVEKALERRSLQGRRRGLTSLMENESGYIGTGEIKEADQEGRTESREVGDVNVGMERDGDHHDERERTHTADKDRDEEEKTVWTLAGETKERTNQSGLLQTESGHDKLGVEEEGVESTEEDEDRSLLWGGRGGGFDDDILLSWGGSEGTHFPALVRVQDLLRREHVFIPLANPERRRVRKGRDDGGEEEDDNDADDGDEEDEDAPEPQIITPESFDSSRSTNAHLLARLRQLEEQKEAMRHEEEEEEFGYTEDNAVRRTYTQAARQLDMQRSAASLFFPASSSRRSLSEQLDPEADTAEGGEKPSLTEKAIESLRRRTEGSGTTTDEQYGASLEEGRIPGYCVGWSDLMAGKQAATREAQIDEEETTEKRRGVVLLPDEYGWRDFFVRGLADRIADCCKCVVLVPHLDPPPSWSPRGEEEQRPRPSVQQSDKEIAVEHCAGSVSPVAQLPSSSPNCSYSSRAALSCPTGQSRDTSLVSAAERPSFFPVPFQTETPPSSVTQSGLCDFSPASSMIDHLAYSFMATQIVHRSLQFLKKQFALDSLAVMGLGPGGGRALECASFLSLLRTEKRKLFSTKSVISPHRDLRWLERAVFLSGGETASSDSFRPPPRHVSRTYGQKRDGSQNSPRSSIPACLPEDGLFPSCISPLYAPELLIPDAVVALYPSGYKPNLVGANIDVPMLAIFAGGDTGASRRIQYERVARERATGQTPFPFQQPSDRERLENPEAVPIARQGGAEKARVLERVMREHDSKFTRDFLIHVVENVRTGFAHRFWDEQSRQVVTDRQAAEDALLVATSWLDIWQTDQSEIPHFGTINDITDFPSSFKTFKPIALPSADGG